jgi:spore germination cell wall hydrolase CwlJ-like protein
LQPPKYRSRRTFEMQDFGYDQPKQKSGLRDIAPYIFGGAMLVAAFAFAGHQMGRNAIAHNAEPDIQVPVAAQQTQQVIQKGSLLVDGDSFELMGLRDLRRQTVVADGKGDMVLMDAGVAPEPEVQPQVLPEPKPVLKPVRQVAKLAEKRMLKIEPAAVNFSEDEDDGSKIKKPLKKLALTAKPDNIADSFKLPKAEKQKTLAQRRVRQAEENCLARAVYFEARSESALGQMAVAKVILNRVKAPNYPKTICGVVYQGSQRRNSCQFSFACDGLPDDVKQPASWAQAKHIAQRAIKGDPSMADKLDGALNYHADYVKPKWARSMRKAIKVGRHIFYTGG